LSCALRDGGLKREKVKDAFKEEQQKLYSQVLVGEREVGDKSDNTHLEDENQEEDKRIQLQQMDIEDTVNVWRYKYRPLHLILGNLEYFVLLLIIEMWIYRGGALCWFLWWPLLNWVIEKCFYNKIFIHIVLYDVKLGEWLHLQYRKVKHVETYKC